MAAGGLSCADVPSRALPEAPGEATALEGVRGHSGKATQIGVTQGGGGDQVALGFHSGCALQILCVLRLERICSVEDTLQTFHNDLNK